MAIRLVTMGSFCGFWFFELTAAFANSPMLVDSRGRIIGYSEAAQCSSISDPSPFFVISASGYYACVRGNTGDFAPLTPLGEIDAYTAQVYGYASSDCSGPAFSWIPGGTSPPAFAGGFVGSAYASDLYYTPKETPLSTLTTLGSYQNSSDPCTQATLIEQAVPAFPNDSVVTGFSSVKYDPPLHVDVLPESLASDEIFFYGFE